MQPHDLAKNYDRLAEHWASNKINPQNGIAAHRLAMQFIDSKKAAIDIGCGSNGRIIDFLLAQKFEMVEGIDASKEMIRLASDRNPDVSFYHADIVNWEFPKTYDFISAWDSIWHVPLAEQENVLRKLCSHLSDDGVLIFTAGGTDVPGEVTNPCTGTDVPLYHATLGIPRLLQLINEFRCDCRHFEFDQWPEKHVYFVVQKRS